MSERSGSELNRALCEALGWRRISRETFGEIDFIWVDPGGQEHWELSSDELPNFLDPGVFWPEFEKWRQALPFPRPKFICSAMGSQDSLMDYMFEITTWLNTRQIFNAFAGRDDGLLTAACRAWLKALEGMR